MLGTPDDHSPSAVLDKVRFARSEGERQLLEHTFPRAKPVAAGEQPLTWVIGPSTVE